MRHLPRLAATGLVAGLAVSACGGTADVLQGKSPQQIITLASTSVSSGAYHMSLDGRMSVDTSGVSGLPSGVMDQLGSMLGNLTMSGSGDVQSSQRMRFSMTMKPILDKAVEVVFYDGSEFLSQDGGKTFADAGSFSFNGLPVSPSDQVALLKDLATVQDEGSTTRDGQSVEHLHATLGPDYISKVLSKLGGNPQMQQFATLFSQVMTLRSGSVDAYVRKADGKLDSEVTNASIAFDMKKLFSVLSQAFGGQVPGGAGGLGNVSGAMVLGESLTVQLSNYGENVQITKPTVDPNAPGLPSGGGLFGV
ncbi:MAG TPA: hypothetical protein VFC09_12235 [Candidatus Dormibacteraeota bacterium]|nr:hypothetical protein [Candidatus Dormibacteraeota bacterium]